ncbi:PulJ/GspJ family protein [Fundidesulfovibrio terrae]|uniref:PulJ/GspJ family protein n=1 Tax=Fundidesulfovibrio terrae TaxID=2922866 RepID=UPI001FAF6DC3|nr:type II secretion system protein [Fundidesulfovibrio terrae]
MNANARQAGFTLLETLLVFVIGAMLAAMVVATMGTSLTRSSTAINVQRGDFLVEQALAQVTRDYVSLTNNEASRATALASLKADIDAGNYNQAGVLTVTSSYVVYSSSGVESADASGTNATLKVTATRTGGRTMSALFSETRPDPTTQLVWY